MGPVTIRLETSASAERIAAVFAGLDWRRVRAVSAPAPEAVEQLRQDDSDGALRGHKGSWFW